MMHRDDDRPAISSERDGPPQRADALVMFGLTGDLGEKKLFEALAQLARAGRLGIPVVAVGRRGMSDDELRAQFHQVVGADDLIERIDLSYVRGDGTDASTFAQLHERLADATVPVVYAALPPSTFVGLATALSTSPFASAARLVLEKPFGHDVASARELHHQITAVIPDDRLFIVDHFLAKAAVENLAVFRHANPLIDRAMRADTVSSIEIQLRETETVEGRGAFYDDVGVVDDVVQNHLLQTAALVLADRPDLPGALGERVARLEVLRSIAAVDPAAAVLGQYAGYRDHDDVDDGSEVPTYVDICLAVDHPRWRGVPVRIVTGKALDCDAVWVTVTLAATATAPSNEIRFELKPHPRIEITCWTLDDDHGCREVTACITAPSDHDQLGDYATLLDDALSGSQHHFADIDSVAECWRIVEPLRHPGSSPGHYAVGSPGPPDEDRNESAAAS